MKVTLPDIMHGLGRLLEVYSRPRHYPEETEAIAKIWQREIGDLDIEVWRAGVSGYCKTNARWFPAPGQIRDIGQGIAHASVAVSGPVGDYERWEREWGNAPLEAPIPCPVCAAVDGWSMNPPMIRRQVYHDAEKHAAAGIPFVGARAEHVAGAAVVPSGAA